MPLRLTRPEQGPCNKHGWETYGVCPDCEDDYRDTQVERRHAAIFMMAALIPGYSNYTNAAKHALEAADALLRELDSETKKD